jgi:hypothetical protein
MSKSAKGIIAALARTEELQVAGYGLQVVKRPGELQVTLRG